MDRKRIGLLSTIIVVVEALIIGILTMIRTRIILSEYGTNINGVVQLAIQLSAYMLLFESGMTAAYQYSMYKPLLSEDNSKISRLYSGMRYDFKVIAVKMILCVLSVAFGYSFVLKNRGVSYFEAVSILSVMGIRIVSPYVFSIPLRTLLIVKEKKYLTDVVETIKNTLVIILEVILIKITDLPLYLILSVQILCTFLSRFLYQYLVNKIFKDECKLDFNAQRDFSPREMTKDIMAHRVAGLISSNTDNILLSFVKELGLNSVTIYTSFASLINYPVTLASRIIEGMRASIALKIQSDSKSAYLCFREVFSFNKLCVLIIIPVFITKGNDFISLWIGDEYTVNLAVLILFSLIAMHQILIPTVYAFRDANGLYKESKKFSIGQALFNLIVSVILVKPLGIVGVLLGTVLSDWFFIETCNLKLVYSRVFSRKLDIVLDYAFLFVITAVSSISCGVVDCYCSLSDTNWVSFIIKSVIIVCISSIIAFGSLYLEDFGFRRLLYRYFPCLRRYKND